MQVNYYKDVY